MNDQTMTPTKPSPRPRKQRTPEDDERILHRQAIVAFLVGVQGIDEADIGTVLRDMFSIGVARCTVTRDMQEIRDRGWLVTRMSDDCPGVEHLNAVKATSQFYGGLQEYLRRTSRGVLQSVQVFWGGATGSDDGGDDWDGLLTRFSVRAAPTVASLLKRADRIGVTWGSTIGANIAALSARSMRRYITPRPGVTVVPTSGEPLGGAKPQFASTDLAEGLSRILGAGAVPSLRGISPVIPEEFRGHAHAVVLQFIRGLRSYQEVFGDGKSTGLVGQLDTVLTSAGSFGERYHAFQNEYIRIPGLSREVLGKLALGDFGGVLIPKDGSFTAAQQKAFKALRELWTGIRIDDFRRISENASKSGRPGVILSAVGANKADIVLALTCRERLVNNLIIDETLARRLSELIKLQPAPDPDEEAQPVRPIDLQQPTV